MKRTLLIAIPDTLGTGVFFAMLVTYQVLFTFQGLDFADEGFSATFYQQIFNDPYAVQYNFMYWFAGIVGGAWVTLFPQGGLIGLRLAGVLVTTLTMVVAYRLLRPYLQSAALKLGLFLTLLVISGDPKIVYHNNLSALFFVVAASLLFHGLVSNSSACLLLSGAFIALNMFTRLANMTGLALSLVIVCHGAMRRQDLKTVARQLIVFVGGFLLSTMAILLLMKGIHHYALFTQSLATVARMGTSAEESHNLLRLIKLAVRQYAGSLGTAATALALLLLAVAMDRLLRARRSTSWLRAVVVCGWVVFVVWLVGVARIRSQTLLSVYTGFSLLAAVIILVWGRSHEIRLLTLLGCGMLFLLPFGSDGGLNMVGKYALWLSVPLAVNALTGVQCFRSQWTSSTSKGDTSVALCLSAAELSAVRTGAVCACLGLGLAFACGSPYFDESNRASMRYSVHHKFLRGIYTTKERAAAVEGLLAESCKYVRRNDYVLAYSSIPMFHYLTETKPYLGHSWPVGYEGDALARALARSEQATGISPVVVLQKVGTVSSNWPVNGTEDPSRWYGYRPQNVAAMDEFLRRHDYQPVWENIAFKILLPAHRTDGMASLLNTPRSGEER